MRNIRIEVGFELTADDLLAQLSMEPSMLGELVAADIKQRGHGDRADVHEIVVVDVELDEKDPTALTLSYSYCWSAYYGCKDIDTGGDEDDIAYGSYEDGCLIFSVPEDRTTHEEF